MARFSSRQALLAGGAFALVLSLNGQVTAQPGYVPNFQTGPNGWQHPFGGEFSALQGSASPVMDDPAHPHFSNEMARINRVQPTYRIGDLSNANLKQWAKDVMKKDNDEVLKGKIAYTPGQACQPPGVPAFILNQGPVVFLQTPTKVTIIEESSQQVRHVYMNVPHSPNPKPSWLGESIGRYEGDTLVIDTIGLNTKTFVDAYRTPHTEKLHVVERWRMVDDRQAMEVTFTVEDPDTYYEPWSGMRRYRRVQRQYIEEICAENHQHLFDYKIPVADKAEF